jgi:DNA-binding transcriptional regulator YiaG
MNCLECGSQTRKTIATPRHPYHFTESGLPDVYLAGIDVLTCRACKSVSPIIPRLPALHRAIALSLARKNGSLTGQEIRFLRKAAGLSAVNFASLLMVEPETLSRTENNRQVLKPSMDKLARAIAIQKIDPETATEILLSLIATMKDARTRLPVFRFERAWKTAA